MIVLIEVNKRCVPAFCFQCNPENFFKETNSQKVNNVSSSLWSSPLSNSGCFVLLGDSIFIHKASKNNNDACDLTAVFVFLLQACWKQDKLLGISVVPNIAKEGSCLQFLRKQQHKNINFNKPGTIVTHLANFWPTSGTKPQLQQSLANPHVTLTRHNFNWTSVTDMDLPEFNRSG